MKYDLIVYSVLAMETHQYACGEQITMKLMKRERGSTHYLPRDQWVAVTGKPHNMDGQCTNSVILFLLKSATRCSPYPSIADRSSSCL